MFSVWIYIYISLSLIPQNPQNQTLSHLPFLFSVFHNVNAPNLSTRYKLRYNFIYIHTYIHIYNTIETTYTYNLDTDYQIIFTFIQGSVQPKLSWHTIACSSTLLLFFLPNKTPKNSISFTDLNEIQQSEYEISPKRF